MAFALAADATRQGFRLRSFEQVGSTNVLALREAQAGDPGRIWFVAREQLSGRGRRGRPWETPAGNLAATLLLVGRWEAGHAATLGFVAGLSLSDALSALVPCQTAIGADGAQDLSGRNFVLKWPNDLLAGKSKLAGILLESVLLADHQIAVAVGIGVNVVSRPHDLAYPATCLSELGANCDAEQVFTALSSAWLDNYRLWDGGRGLAAVRSRWLERAAGIGSQVAVRLASGVVRGVFETINEDCRFVIRTPAGAAIAIAAGEVHFGAVASEAAG